MRLSLKAKTHNYLQNLQTETFRTCILMRQGFLLFAHNQIAWYFINFFR
jgi:hypothetical protein